MKYSIFMIIETAANLEIEAANENEAKTLAANRIREFLNNSGAAVFAVDEYTKIDIYDWDEIGDE